MATKKWECCSQPYRCASGNDFCPGYPPFTEEEIVMQDICYLAGRVFNGKYPSDKYLEVQARVLNENGSVKNIKKVAGASSCTVRMCVNKHGKM